MDNTARLYSCLKRIFPPASRERANLASTVTEYFNCRHDINWIVAEEQTLPGAFRDSSLFCFELKFKCKQTRKPSYRNQAVAI